MAVEMLSKTKRVTRERKNVTVSNAVEPNYSVWEMKDGEIGSLPLPVFRYGFF